MIESSSLSSPPSQSSSSCISFRSVIARYGFKVALRDVDLEIPRGETVVLLGENGSGKSTFIRLITGTVTPKNGKVEVAGLKPGSLAANRSLGYAPEDAQAPELFTAQEYLRLVAGLRVPRERVEEAVRKCLEQLGLPALGRVRTLSKGMRRRVVLGQALVGDPALVVLDEPFNGLDALGVAKLRVMLSEAKARGATVLLSTHLLGEVQHLCDRLLVLAKGKVVAFLTMAEALEKYGTIERVVEVLYAGQEVER